MNNLGFSLLLTLLLCSALVHADPPQSVIDADKGGNMQDTLRLLKAQAEQGDTESQFILGFLYSNGTDVPEDDKEGVAWYRMAAEKGHAGAQFNLGLMYANGEGVPEDAVLAYLWWNMAGANGEKHATEARQIVSKQMTPAQIEQAQALSRQCFEQNYKNCGK